MSTCCLSNIVVFRVLMFLLFPCFWFFFSVSLFFICFICYFAFLLLFFFFFFKVFRQQECRPCLSLAAQRCKVHKLMDSSSQYLVCSSMLFLRFKRHVSKPYKHYLYVYRALSTVSATLVSSNQQPVYHY